MKGNMAREGSQNGNRIGNGMDIAEIELVREGSQNGNRIGKGMDLVEIELVREWT